MYEYIIITILSIKYSKQATRTEVRDVDSFVSALGDLSAQPQVAHGDQGIVITSLPT